ncbi:MAG: hypothetical protein O3B74_01575 [Proteobacteria bacterium]|nr:hypothetical protein [Pseudomonadota bacterium]MDA1308077.1 hypothetical protein [Pseudomonadota bacterium]
MELPQTVLHHAKRSGIDWFAAAVHAIEFDNIFRGGLYHPGSSVMVAAE